MGDMGSNMSQLYSDFKKSISDEFEGLINTSVRSKVWDNGEYNGERIMWRSFEIARKNIPLMQSSGIYVWGSGMDVIYIGKAQKQSIEKRLNSRYIGGKKSQCGLCDSLPKEAWALSAMIMKDKYSLASIERAEGAKRFYDSGIDSVWFIPIKLDPRIIPCIEATLIGSFAAKWGLINKEFT